MCRYLTFQQLTKKEYRSFSYKFFYKKKTTGENCKKVKIEVKTRFFTRHVNNFFLLFIFLICIYHDSDGLKLKILRQHKFAIKYSIFLDSMYSESYTVLTKYIFLLWTGVRGGWPPLPVWRHVRKEFSFWLLPLEDNIFVVTR